MGPNYGKPRDIFNTVLSVYPFMVSPPLGLSVSHEGEKNLFGPVAIVSSTVPENSDGYILAFIKLRLPKVRLWKKVLVRGSLALPISAEPLPPLAACQVLLGRTPLFYLKQFELVPRNPDELLAVVCAAAISSIALINLRTGLSQPERSGKQTITPLTKIFPSVVWGHSQCVFERGPERVEEFPGGGGRWANNSCFKRGCVRVYSVPSFVRRTTVGNGRSVSEDPIPDLASIRIFGSAV